MHITFDIEPDLLIKKELIVASGPRFRVGNMYLERCVCFICFLLIDMSLNCPWGYFYNSHLNNMFCYLSGIYLGGLGGIFGRFGERSLGKVWEVFDWIL